MMNSTEKLTEFKREFDVPTKDFNATEKKEIKIVVEYNIKETNDYMRGSKVGVYHFEDCFFKLVIPKYIFHFIRNKFREYSKDGIGNLGTYQEGNIIWKDKYNFTQIIRSEKLKDTIHIFNQIILDALYIKKLENLKKNKKVIFVKSNQSIKAKHDNYNYGNMGNLVNLQFHYFVAYKVFKTSMIKEYWQNRGFKEDEVIEYYALEQYQNKSFGTTSIKNKRALPKLTGHNLQSFKEIPWTKEREEFFSDVEFKINKLAGLVNNFVEDIDEKNIDKKIIENKDRNLLLLK